MLQFGTAIATVLIIGLSSQVAAQTTDANLPECGLYPSDQAEYQCSCSAGFSTGGVWGTGPYTGDSNICAAAQQSGVITPKGGTVLAVKTSGQDTYEGGSKNGVTSSSWHSYDFSFVPELVKGPTDKPAQTALEACNALSDGVDSYSCNCAPAALTAGSVWGSSPYTIDSSICPAALHSGVVGEKGGDVTVLRVQGLSRYTGSSSFGITTNKWGEYRSSFVFDWN